MTTYYTGVFQAPSVSRAARAPFIALDFGQSSTTATKAIAGFVYDSNGNTVIGATVDLIRDLDDTEWGKTTSNSMGYYSFTRDAADPYTYHVVAYTVVSGSTQIHGTSDRGNIPT